MGGRSQGCGPYASVIDSLTACQNEVKGDCCWHALQPFLSCPAADIKARVSTWIAKHPSHPSYPPTTVSASSFVSQWGLDAAVQAFHEHLPSGLVVFHCPTNLLMHYQACCAPHMCLDATLPLSFATSPSLLYTERNPDGVGHFERLAYVPATPFLCLSPPPFVWACELERKHLQSPTAPAKKKKNKPAPMLNPP